ncbi:ankyrin repeat and LEM domain-containing protein 2 [Corythoichthys intestinalis]|uniref:ankyrin repeat and LEM domain-containing protein 2 n=1 Tax=Corythoichthys intestinalis TaxID=161448 RepID=UPI0025A5569B|nr:ankyrin repeat and LEM domain-containing protein 2 [Corythoichthys intestinalis]XP_057688117.1 ankyrin repeat and LEM domain-containing protein 2 [Corythoichthys intestinalis]XP_057688118.1 ankyrin repeat and LEM domain-containing protein 2 [Corythoichthys intestinalis]XP_057688119.1 ankyrin repeat and LEM domain-containing protein 2 [Corythoichthys intestinalis]XP_061804740.1 ankyrin repeat and LEM domain-containing protein 2-like [Nerophis lumbriciformis]
MEAVLIRLKGLTADELREEIARANLKCVAVTATTRSILEKKLARRLAGPESGADGTDNISSESDGDGLAKVAEHAKPLLNANSTAAASGGPIEEPDFGYGVGLNPPDEEEICNSQSKMKTHSKVEQVSPPFYYGVLSEDILCRNERVLVYTDKKDALQAVKGMKGARFNRFSNREDAEKFAMGMSDYFPSPSKSMAGASPVKAGQIVSKDIMEVDTTNRERANSYKSPRTQDLTTKLRKAVEKGDEVAFSEVVWSNPRYLIGSGDNPTIVQEGCRYNVMHVAAKENQAGIAQLLLDILENPEFMRLMYPDDQEDMLQKRICYIVDLYLNTPDKAGFETPLHFACKFGCPDVVNLLCSHPVTDKNRTNSEGQKPCDIICSRKNTTQEVRQKISDYLEDRCYIPLLRAADNTSQPIIGAPWSPEASESLSLIQRHTRSPLDPLMTVTAFAGPLSPSKAGEFRHSWKTPPRNQAERFHNILKSDPERGAERVGRDLAHEMGYPWAEYWDFLESFVDLSSTKGLKKLEEYLSKKDFFSRTCEEGENETSNRFKTPSPGKPKKFCNSISVGAFLDEGEDISLEEMKNRQNAALTSITTSAASMENLKGAVGGHDIHIMPMGLKYRGDDLIETAAEQDLLSPGVCKNGVAPSREGISKGDKALPRSSPSSSLRSPVSNLSVAFERMSLQEPPDSPDGCRERRNSGEDRHRETLESIGSSTSIDLSSELKQLLIGHDSQSEALKGEDAGERCSSGSSEEFFEAVEDSLEMTSRTRAGALGMRNLCARSKSWDHGGKDLSSSGSSASSYKSLDNAHEFFPRTPPHIRRGLFIDGDSPTKLDRDVLSAIGDVEVDVQKYPSVHKWMSTIRSYSFSEMQSWHSPAVVKQRLRTQHQTPGSPSSILMSPSGRFSPARHAASPDFSPGRYSPANVSYIQRIRLNRLNEASI